MQPWLVELDFTTELSVLVSQTVVICVTCSCCDLFQGHPTGKPERSALSLATQLLLCQQSLLIPGLLLHCFAFYYTVLTATPPHSSAHSSALHPLVCTVAGRGPWLANNPHQSLKFVERKVWAARLFPIANLRSFSLWSHLLCQWLFEGCSTLMCFERWYK